MKGGRPLAPHPPLAAIRDRCAAQVAALPDGVRRLEGAAPYPVGHGARLLAVQRALEAELEATQVRHPAQ